MKFLFAIGRVSIVNRGGRKRRVAGVQGEKGVACTLYSGNRDATIGNAAKLVIMGARKHETDKVPKIPDCDRCYFRAYNQPIVCAVHPAGPVGESCLDFQPDPAVYIDHLLIVVDDRGRKEFILKSSFYTVGRDAQCDIRLYSPFVSRRHATLLQLRGENGTIYYRIVDGNSAGQRSRNGLFINGCKIEFHDLKSGDEIIFGYQARGIYEQVLRPIYSGANLLS